MLNYLIWRARDNNIIVRKSRQCVDPRGALSFSDTSTGLRVRPVGTLIRIRTRGVQPVRFQIHGNIQWRI